MYCYVKLRYMNVLLLFICSYVLYVQGVQKKGSFTRLWYCAKDPFFSGTICISIENQEWTGTWTWTGA